jgi:ATP-binding cassette subfamily C (CFTR/MRP) protein 1
MIAIAEHRGSLIFALFKTLRWEFLAPILPRLALIGLTLAQPLLINRVIDFLGQNQTTESHNIGYGLIGAYIILYVGIGVCSITSIK